jgi:signal peptidase I
MNDPENSKPSASVDYIVLPPKQETRRNKQKPSQLSDILSVVFVFVAAVILALCLITFVFQSYQVDGPSMQNTLQNNDRLIVWKVPRTLARITGTRYVPQRGNVIIFIENNLADFGQTDSKQLVKRVIGLPGDRVVVKDGAVTIYNSQFPSGFQPDKTLDYGKKAALPYTSGDVDITLKTNQIFVCGDNRINSLDSRAFGPVNVNDIVGRLVLRVYPFGTFQSF